MQGLHTDLTAPTDGPSPFLQPLIPDGGAAFEGEEVA
jgi:hypothetical protein